MLEAVEDTSGCYGNVCVCVWGGGGGGGGLIVTVVF